MLTAAALTFLALFLSELLLFKNNYKRLLKRTMGNRRGSSGRNFLICLQIIIYTANLFVWIICVLALIYGMIVGLGTDTIRVLESSDLQISTPATILILYGIFVILLATLGCFSSITASVVLSLVYLVLIVVIFCFDLFFGERLLFSTNFLQRYYKTVNNSFSEYHGSSKTKSGATVDNIGPFKVTPEKFWDHLQSRGECCGLIGYEDWRRSPYSSMTYNIPDSCCNLEYSYRTCGEQLFRHPDTEGHSLADIVWPKGCITIFPKALGLSPDGRIGVTGLAVGILLLICFLATILIIICVVMKTFRPEEGLNNPDYIEPDNNDNAYGDNMGMGMGMGPGPGQGPQGVSRVYPEPGHEDWTLRDRHSQQGPHHGHNPNQRSSVAFRESGPQFIHDGNRQGQGQGQGQGQQSEDEKNKNKTMEKDRKKEF